MNESSRPASGGERQIDSITKLSLAEQSAGQVHLRAAPRQACPEPLPLAAQFGGGGHRAAAGARIAGPASSVQRRVIAAIKKSLDDAS